MPSGRTTASNNKNDKTSSSSSSFSSSWWTSVGAVLIAYRITMANRMPIMDCDEVYNYWEPLHFLHYGSGMQTWEYAPSFALRTYAYLAPMVGLSHVFEFLQGLQSWCGPFLFGSTMTTATTTTKIWTFGCLRSTLAGWTALSEVQFCQALHQRTNSQPLATWTFFMMATSTGMSHAAGAYLPSSTLLILFLQSSTCWLQQKYIPTMAYAVVATLACGWPFGALLFVPMGFHVLCHSILQKTWKIMILSTFVWILGVQGIVMTEDYKHYGRWVSPTFNIFKYNIEGAGDELYGVEPLSYYLKNLALNFNYVAVLAVLFPAFSSLLEERSPNGISSSLLRSRSTPKPSQQRTPEEKLKTQNEVTLRILLSPLFLWFVVVLPRPHKEERFLFPIYPLLCVGAAVTMDKVGDLLQASRWGLGASSSSSKHQRMKTKLYGGLLLLLPSTIMSISRTMALSKYYTAPLSIYAQIPSLPTPPQKKDDTRTTPKNLLVCTCGEWYRFPSSYYLPPGYELGFLPCSFKGQLPQPFTKYGSKDASMSIQKGTFNDVNREETDRYVSSVSKCSYVMELVKNEEEEDDNIPECLQYMMADNKKNKKWTSIASFPYLDASRTSTLHRMFYIPIWHEREIQSGSIKYNSYTLYENPHL